MAKVRGKWGCTFEQDECVVCIQCYPEKYRHLFFEIYNHLESIFFMADSLIVLWDSFSGHTDA